MLITINLLILNYQVCDGNVKHIGFHGVIYGDLPPGANLASGSKPTTCIRKTHLTATPVQVK